MSCNNLSPVMSRLAPCSELTCALSSQDRTPVLARPFTKAESGRGPVHRGVSGKRKRQKRERRGRNENG